MGDFDDTYKQLLQQIESQQADMLKNHQEVLLMGPEAAVMQKKKGGHRNYDVQQDQNSLPYRNFLRNGQSFFLSKEQEVYLKQEKPIIKEIVG